MKAVVLEESGARPVVRDDERVAPAAVPGRAVVRVEAAGFSHHDALVLSGVLRRGVRTPLVLGHEVAGVVEATGERVVVLPGTLGHAEDGGFAELVSMREDALVPVPRALSAEGAALLASPIGVAVKAVADVGGVAPGQTVVVVGVSGGLGVHAAQVAHSLGARVIGVTGSAAKMAALEGMAWLDALVGPGDLPWSETVRALTDDAGADVVVDTVGAEGSVDGAVRSLARGGRVVLLGQIAREPSAFTAAELVFREGSIVGSLGVERTHVGRAIAMVEAGDVVPVIDRVLPMSATSVLEAYRLLRERAVIGRVVLQGTALHP